VLGISSANNIKAVVFDMDGVLVDAREWHFLALNQVLEPLGIAITEKEHLGKYDGLSTKVKLEMLSADLGLPTELHAIISKVKQDRTLRIANQFCYPNIRHQILLSRLRVENFKIGLVTNSIRETTKFMLKRANVFHFLDVVVTNEDVKNPKPDPEGYLLCCEELQLKPEEVLVVEDGIYGIEAAKRAGCNVLKVDSPKDVSLEILSELVPQLVGLGK
jgi:HAD superfamily hydrolase (TIGR01509 family)